MITHEKQANRDRLVAAAQHLFMRQGFEETTARQIAEQAKVSERTFFRYFPTKVEAAFPFHQERYERLKALLEKHCDSQNPFRAIRAALEEFGSEYSKHSEQLLREWRFVNSSPQLIARDTELDWEHESLFYDALLKGRFSDQEARIMAGVVFGGIRATLNEWLSHECRQELRNVADSMMAMLDWLATAYENNLQPMRFAVSE